MTENPSGQVPADFEGQEPTEQIDRGQVPEERFDAEYVKKLRSEAAEYRRKLRELEAVVKQHNDEKLSETERLRNRLIELEKAQLELQQDRQERVLRYETMLAASRLGIIDPDAAYRLLDLTAIEFDDDGTPKNIEKVLRDLIRAKPYLVGNQNAINLTNPAVGQQRTNVFTASQIADRRFYEQHRDEILRAMAEGRIIQG